MPALRTSSRLRPPAPCLFCQHRIPKLTTSAPFSSTPRRRTDEPPPSHYETLGIAPHAEPSEIKKSFYALSKRHHPDRNPGNPHSAKAFVRISEAYHVLSSPESRSRYDRQHNLHTHGRTPRGSHSSHSATGPAGGRPASGLNRRRTQFRGPPPSFYRNGGWAAQAAKRAGAQYASSSGGAQEEAQASPFGAAGEGAGTSAGGHGSGGFSPGQQGPEYDPDPSIPYWDKAGHFRTHERIRARSETVWRARTQRQEEQRWQQHGQRSSDASVAGGGMLYQFVAVWSCIVFVLGTSGWLFRARERRTGAVERRENG